MRATAFWYYDVGQPWSKQAGSTYPLTSTHTSFATTVYTIHVVGMKCDSFSFRCIYVLNLCLVYSILSFMTYTRANRFYTYIKKTTDDTLTIVRHLRFFTRQQQAHVRYVPYDKKFPEGKRNAVSMLQQHRCLCYQSDRRG